MVDRILDLAYSRKRISLKGLEKKVGLHNIYRWDENIPSVDKVVKVADFLGVSVDSLLGRCSDPSGRSAKEERLILCFYKLNEAGQDKIIDYAEDLASSGRYIYQAADVEDN